MPAGMQAPITAKPTKRSNWPINRNIDAPTKLRTTPKIKPVFNRRSAYSRSVRYPEGHGLKQVKFIVAAAMLCAGTQLAAGEPARWQVEPPGEGSAEAYVYTTDTGRFLAGPDGSGIWVVYSGIQAPRADGSCTFDSCTINVTLEGEPGYAQKWVRFAFSDGSSVIAHPNVRAGQYNTINDFGRVYWPQVSGIMDGLRKANWVDVSFADGTKKRFQLAGSSAAFQRGAASVSGS